MQNQKELHLEGEIWLDIKNYEGLYQVSNLGRVIKLTSHKFDKYKNNPPHLVAISGNEYPHVQLNKKGRITRNIHRLVAETFIPNPENKRVVGHINNNGWDNRVENLEWLTYSENSKNAYLTGVQVNAGKKKLINTITGEIFESLTRAANILKISRTNLSQQLSGVNNRVNKTGLKYLEENKQFNPFEEEEINLDEYEILQWNDNWNKLRTNKNN